LGGGRGRLDVRLSARQPRLVYPSRFSHARPIAMAGGRPARSPLRATDCGAGHCQRLCDRRIRRSLFRVVVMVTMHSVAQPYCMWRKPADSSGHRPAWAPAPEIVPMYGTRMLEQRRICDGSLKRGHRTLGVLCIGRVRVTWSRSFAVNANSRSSFRGHAQSSQAML
jgi:hypothetical protein